MLDINNLIIDNLDIWSSTLKKKKAVGRGSSKKIEIYGVKKLRELILSLAISGLLVPQDSNDRNANELLEEISLEKEKLLKAGKIRKQKSTIQKRKNNKDETLPNGWVHAYFGDVLFNRDAERIPLSVDDRKNRQGKYDYYGASGVIDSIDNYLFDKPLLLIGEDGANLINRSSPIAFIARGKYWVNNHAHVLDGLNESLLMYVCLHINAISLESFITGTAQPKMNQAKMNSILLRLPPLNEQKRIVAKVDELMALCDQLEKQQEDSINAHQTLVKTLLDALVDSASHNQTTEGKTKFEQAWKRIAQHFDTLFTTEDSIDQLKQTILQLAVMGKLVPQDPDAGTASEELENLSGLRCELVEQGELKKRKVQQSSPDSEALYQIPTNWAWCYLDSLITDADSGWSPACPPTPSPSNEVWGVLKTTAVQVMEYRAFENKVLDSEKEPRPQHEVKKGDILITRAGPINRVGVSCLVEETRPRLMISDKIIRFHLLSDEMSARYISLCLNAGETQKYIEESKSGMAESQMNISQTKLKNAPIPFPPSEEQHRIIEAVDKLIGICDELRSNIIESNVIQFKLTDAMSVKVLN